MTPPVAGKSISRRTRTQRAPAPPAKNEPPKGSRPVEFLCLAVPGSRVSVVCAANNWDPKATPMQESQGQYRATLRLPRGRHEYKFVVNGEWRIDPRSPQTVPNAYGSLNSVIEV